MVHESGMEFLDRYFGREEKEEEKEKEKEKEKEEKKKQIG